MVRMPSHLGLVPVRFFALVTTNSGLQSAIGGLYRYPHPHVVLLRLRDCFHDTFSREVFVDRDVPWSCLYGCPCGELVLDIRILLQFVVGSSESSFECFVIKWRYHDGGAYIIRSKFLERCSILT
mmetsp:Transcript_86258/g.134884  ORF Transcript_86258/g.134884 Transcript_86258/m.134884 type:complete len:125 (+) Transcript_86258:800-1174(+)